jgi:hypothetical protein
LFVGVILVLIGYPIIILILSFSAFALLLTIWAWMPIFLLITYLFNVLIKNFETNHDLNGFWGRTFPLVRIAFKTLVHITFILLIFLNLVLLAPLKSILLALYTITIYSIRIFLDKTMLWVFRNLGRTPSRDTFIAKKISGPGMSKDFYMSIN